MLKKHILIQGIGTATCLIFEKETAASVADKAGICFLRTYLNGKEEQTRREIYNLIRKIGYTFRILKTDLDLRTVYPKTDEPPWRIFILDCPPIGSFQPYAIS